MANCPRCKSGIERSWEFCPKCGARLVRERKDLFSSIFEAMNKQLRQVNKAFDRDIEAVDISPWFKKPKGKGFSIRISSGTGRPPNVEVHGFGGVNEQKLRQQVNEQLGIKREPAARKDPEPLAKTPTPKLTEEPKTNIKRANGKVLVDLEIPAKGPEDIQIRELESSVEVKALVKDKAFFKILTKPANTRITNKSFTNKVLHLEFS